MERKDELQSRSFTVDTVAERVSEVLGILSEDVCAAGRHRETALAHSLLGYWSVRELGVTMISLSRRLKVSAQAIGKWAV